MEPKGLSDFELTQQLAAIKLIGITPDGVGLWEEWWRRSCERAGMLPGYKYRLIRVPHVLDGACEEWRVPTAEFLVAPDGTATFQQRAAIERPATDLA